MLCDEAGALVGEGGSKLLFLQLPTALPLAKPSAGGGGDPPPVKASEFLAALSHASDYADPAADTGLATARQLFDDDAAAAGLRGEVEVYRSGKVVLRVGGVGLTVQPGAACSFEQELACLVPAAAPAKAPAPGDDDEEPPPPVDLHRVGRVHQRLVVTPDVPALLEQVREERRAVAAAPPSLPAAALAKPKVKAGRP